MDLIEHFKGKKIYAIEHVDLDGITSRICLEYFLAPIAKVIHLNTVGYEMKEVDRKLAINVDTVIFADFAPSKELYEYITSHNVEIFIFDHHLTSRNELGELPNYYFDENKCGSQIVFDEFTQGKRVNKCLKQLIELVNIYDLWRVDSLLWLQSKNLSNVLYSYCDWRYADTIPDTFKYVDFIKVQLDKIKDNKKFYFTMYEQVAIKKALEKENKSYNEALKNLRYGVDSLGIPYAYTSCNSKMSFVSHRLLSEMQEKIDYIAIWGSYDKSSLNLSIRSQKIDVSKIAEKWGGGGHKGAAGMTFKTIEELNNFKVGNIHLQ